MLSEKDRKVLDFEGSWWMYPGPKDQAIRDYVDMSATRYYQALRRLMDDREAVRHAPLVVHRLRRMRRERLDSLARRAGSDGAG
jgi:hypothetical protein